MCTWITYSVLCVLLSCGFTDSVSNNTKQYTIGVGITGDATAFLRQWKPLLVDYLTSEVGSLYDPRIEFKVTPVDYDIKTSTSALIPAGVLDFVCKFTLIYDLCDRKVRLISNPTRLRDRCSPYSPGVHTGPVWIHASRHPTSSNLRTRDWRTR